MTFAYAWPPSIVAGGTVRLHVRTDAPRLSLRVRRAGAFADLCDPIRAPAVAAPPGRCDRPWEWPACEVTVPRGAAPGVYVAACDDGVPRDPAKVDGRDGRALFVVRPERAAARVAYVLPLFTYHAYNVATHEPGGDDRSEGLYTGAKAVTLARPGGGTGGRLWDEANSDAYDSASPRQTFAHWDEKALRWLRSEGVQHEVLTDWDLHGGRSLADYRLLLFFGHHEYWTRPMRRRVTTFLAGGGNVALFCANTCWFRIRYDAQARAISREGRWLDDPEDGLTGLSYANGGGKWIGPRPATGFRVLAPTHWLFEGCGLGRGDVFGAERRLVGYECDGVADDPTALGAPSSLEVLAQGSLAQWPVADGSGEVSSAARSSIVAYRRGGIMVSAGTTDWARLLGVDATVSRVTRNALARLGAGTPHGDGPLHRAERRTSASAQTGRRQPQPLFPLTSG